MSDTILDDVKILHARAHDYARLLASAAEGHVLWQPTKVDVAGKLGDCGQITDGRFYKYFNVFDADSGFPHIEFDAQYDKIITTQRPPDTNLIKSQPDIDILLEGEPGLHPSLMRASVGADVPWRNGELAFVQLLGDCKSMDFTPAPKRKIMDYLVKYHSEIRERLGDVPGTIVVLTSVVHSTSWLGAIARQGPPRRLRSRWLDQFQARTAPRSTHKGPTSQPTVAVAQAPEDKRRLSLGNFGQYTRGPADQPDEHYCVVVGTMQGNAIPTAADAIRDSTTSDALSKLLDRTLQANPSAEEGVASWDVLTDFYREYPDGVQDVNTGVQIASSVMPNNVATINELFRSSPEVYLPQKYVPLERRSTPGSDVLKFYSVDMPSMIIAVKVLHNLLFERSDVVKNQLRALEREMRHLKEYRHRNILQYLGLARLRSGDIGIASRYAANGPLPEYLQNNPGADRMKIVREVAAGLEYLHSCHAIHGSVQPYNVLIMDDQTAVLSDFGLFSITPDIASHPLRDPDSNSYRSIIPYYLAPETFAPAYFPEHTLGELKRRLPEYGGLPRRTTESDVFAFGMLAFTTLGGDPARALGRGIQVPVALAEGKRPLREDGAQVDDLTWELINECWQLEPARRPTMASVSRRLSPQPE
ncbi:kinase-like protein [Auricularia subglabra TFB-10046 SS5]|nr:kinase-like protein [Auricularia subglabra TFB-10046 SS5]